MEEEQTTASPIYIENVRNNPREQVKTTFKERQLVLISGDIIYCLYIRLKDFVKPRKMKESISMKQYPTKKTLKSFFLIYKTKTLKFHFAY